EPGVLEHTYSNRFDLGEPDGSKSERAQAFSQAMIKAGFRCPVRPRIRENLWVKLWGNLSFNMICSLTTATLDVVTGDPGTRAVSSWRWCGSVPASRVFTPGERCLSRRMKRGD